MKQLLLTKSYILNNRTKKGSWTQSQLDVLGVTWPPKKRWLNRVVGRNITSDERANFERNKYKFKQAF